MITSQTGQSALGYCARNSTPAHSNLLQGIKFVCGRLRMLPTCHTQLLAKHELPELQGCTSSAEIGLRTRVRCARGGLLPKPSAVHGAAGRLM
eukprot:1159365-Pelagomonas_calceolata.AAC.2